MERFARNLNSVLRLFRKVNLKNKPHTWSDTHLRELHLLFIPKQSKSCLGWNTLKIGVDHLRVGTTAVRHFHRTVECRESNELPNIIPSSKHKTRSEEKIQKISKAMRAYMQRAQDHDNFIKEQTEEFQMGKRHLANMMGVDPDHMTQKDINEAIEYLMPSGLFEPKARPFMKHPDEIFKKRKAAEFDMSGRPFHFLFYTRSPQFYEVLYNVAIKLEDLDAFQDKMIKQGILQPQLEMKLILTSSNWITLEELIQKLEENVLQINYDYFIVSMTRLTEHPYAYREKDFIMSFRKNITSGVTEILPPPLSIAENGQPSSTAKGTRKNAKATVTVRGNGSGKFQINGQEITYFEKMQDREQILFPLQFTGLLGKVDLEAQVVEGGPTGQAGAIRYATSRALLSFVDKAMMQDMCIAGLLTRDPRRRERKKPGQKGARAKYTWKKR